MRRTLLASAKVLALAATLSALLFGLPKTNAQTPTPGAQVDLAALQQLQIDAVNNGDVQGALSFLTDDAVVQGSAGCITPCVGKAAIQKEYQNEVAGHTHVTRTSVQVTGTTLTGRFEVTADAIRAAGVDRVAGSYTTEFRGDKISSIRLQIDLTDPQTAKFIASLAAKAPSTGTGGYVKNEGGAHPMLAAALAAAIGAIVFLAGAGTLALARRRN